MQGLSLQATSVRFESGPAPSESHQKEANLQELPFKNKYQLWMFSPQKEVFFFPIKTKAI